ncbi:S41 family peptidase [Floricoccus penangensis]|uniref:S41 family peptidase n=1 Tax=Floricoccus penangensis TaxID=1859475 RepID=UPI00203C2808|nr:S41 family peptidase [Floricoccus penangensis]URZ87077.1 Nisin-resistance protein [Floricoccus penangensis]
MKKLKKLLITLTVSMAALFGILYLFGPKFNLYLSPPSPEKYGKIALNNMDEGLFAEGNRWKEAKENAKKELKGVKSYDDTQPILEKAIKVAGGKHSFFDTTTGLESSKVTFPTSKTENNTLIITIPEFISPDKKEHAKYSNVIREAIENNEYNSVILDFRNNIGGNMWPMIDGLSPLLPNKKLLSFISRKGAEENLTLSKNSITNGREVQKISESKKIVDKPIAILINDHTASSGEIVSLCFKSLKNVKYYGGDSAAYTTSNMLYPLFDGRLMFLTTQKIKDDTGHIYENTPIEPDVRTNDALNEALKELNK